MNNITIFTPTYNRINTLKNTYDSLKNQTDKNFIWMIIDDGSTDETEKVVSDWKKEGIVNIEYFKKKNGGKHSAYNMFMSKVQTQYCLIALDSDDIIVEDGIEYLNKKISDLNDKQCGIVCIRSKYASRRDETCKKYDINKLSGNSLKSALENNMFAAECSFLFETDYIKKFRYPEIEKENFFTEAYVYYQLDKEIYWSDKILTLGAYLEDGLTKNSSKLFFNNPTSWMMFNELRMKQNKSFIKRIKYTIYFIAFSLMSGNNPFKNNNKIKIFILYPIGIIGKNYITRRNKI